MSDMFEVGPSERKRLKRSDLNGAGDECPSLAAFIECQAELNIIDRHLSDEIGGITRKYNSLSSRLYDHRADLTKRLTDFWVTSMENHPRLYRLVADDRVQQVLTHLVAIDSEYSEDDPGEVAKLHFCFEENPYLENERLTKVVTPSGEKSSSIRWKQIMGFLRRKDDADGSSGSKKRKRRRHRHFFEWFSDDEHVNHEVCASFEDISKDPLAYSPFFLDDTEHDPGTDAEDRENAGSDTELNRFDFKSALSSSESETSCTQSNKIVVQAEIHEPPESAGRPRQGSGNPALRRPNRSENTLNHIDLDRIDVCEGNATPVPLVTEPTNDYEEFDFTKESEYDDGRDEDFEFYR